MKSNALILILFIITAAALALFLLRKDASEEESVSGKKKEPSKKIDLTEEAKYYSQLWEPPEDVKYPEPYEEKITTPNYIIAVKLNGYKVEWLKIDYAFKAGEFIANKISTASTYEETVRLTKIGLQEMFPEISIFAEKNQLYAFAYRIWKTHRVFKEAGVYSYYIAEDYKDALIKIIEDRFDPDYSNDPEFTKKEWAPAKAKASDDILDYFMPV